MNPTTTGPGVGEGGSRHTRVFPPQACVLKAKLSPNVISIPGTKFSPRMMTGRIDDARTVARQIIGSNRDGSSQQLGGNQTSPILGQGPFQQFSQTQAKDLQSTIMQLLENADDTVLSTQNKTGQTLLHLAALSGLNKLITFLLERNPTVDTADDNGYTPLHLATLAGRYTAVRMLLENCSSISIRNKSSQTPLNVAKLYQQPDIEELLLQSPANQSRMPPLTQHNLAQHSRRRSRTLVPKAAKRRASVNSSCSSPSSSAVLDDDTTLVHSETESVVGKLANLQPENSAADLTSPATNSTTPSSTLTKIEPRKSWSKLSALARSIPSTGRSEATEDIFRFYYTQARAYRGLDIDKMLYFFWLPLLFFGFTWALIQAFSIPSNPLLSSALSY